MYTVYINQTHQLHHDKYWSSCKMNDQEIWRSSVCNGLTEKFLSFSNNRCFCLPIWLLQETMAIVLSSSELLWDKNLAKMVTFIVKEINLVDLYIISQGRVLFAKLMTLVSMYKFLLLYLVTSLQIYDVNSYYCLIEFIYQNLLVEICNLINLNILQDAILRFTVEYHTIWRIQREPMQSMVKYRSKQTR